MVSIQKLLLLKKLALSTRQPHYKIRLTRTWYNSKRMIRMSKRKTGQSGRIDFSCGSDKTHGTGWKKQGHKTQSLKRPPIYMIGHAGMGYGSSIKGCRLYGEQWMRSRRKILAYSCCASVLEKIDINKSNPIIMYSPNPSNSSEQK